MGATTTTMTMATAADLKMTTTIRMPLRHGLGKVVPAEAAGDQPPVEVDGEPVPPKHFAQ